MFSLFRLFFLRSTNWFLMVCFDAKLMSHFCKFNTTLGHTEIRRGKGISVASVAPMLVSSGSGIQEIGFH